MSEAKLPKPLDGRTTAEEMKFEPTRLSYLSAEAVAKDIAGQLKKTIGSKTAVIVGMPLLADFTNLVSALTTLEGLLQDYRAVPRFGRGMAGMEEGPAAPALEAVPMAAPLSVAAAATQVLGVISLFREDVDYKGVETVVDPLSFEIALASALKANGASRVIIPDLFVVSPDFLVDDGLRQRLEEVHAAKGDAWDAVAPSIRGILDLEAELERAHSRDEEAEVERISAELRALRERMDPVSERLSSVDRRLSELERTLEQRVEGQAMTGLGRLLRAEAILERSASKPDDESDDSVFVHAQVVASGGHQRISRHLFRMLFLGDGLSFLGGVVARWAVLARDGEFHQGGIRHASYFSRFRSPGVGSSFSRPRSLPATRLQE